MLKGIVAWWGKNPVAGNLLMLACAIAGFLSFQKMEKEFFPPGKDQGVRIEAYWPGASPEDMENQVTVRLEEAVADLNGINWVRSRSGEGYAWINLNANPGVDIQDLTQEARSRIDAISGLPSSLEPPRVQQSTFRDWTYIISVHGKNANERVLRETAERLRDKLAVIDGASNTIVVGARRPEVSIEISEEALRGYGLTFDDVASAIRRSSINLSSGSVRTQDGDYQLRARNLADTRIDFEAIIVRQTPDGGVVKVGDVARVIDGFEDVNVYSRMNGDPSLLVTVQVGDTFNIWDVSKEVDKVIKSIEPQLPTGIEITKVYNQSEDYNALTGILFSNALQGFGLIFLLLLLTLHPKVAIWATIGVMTAFLGSFFILLLTPLFTWLWPWLEARGRNPSKPMKSAIGLLFGGLAFVPMLLAAQQIGNTGQMASVWWLVLAYFIFEIGELCLSPIGLSAVTQLSVARVVGLMMGGFWLATAYSEMLAAQFGKLASLDVPEDGTIDMAGAASKYADLFQLLLWIGLGSALLFLLLAPLLRRMMHGVK